MNCTRNWESLTTDYFILDIIKNGLKLAFTAIPPSNSPSSIQGPTWRGILIGKEVEKLLHKGIITVSKECAGDFYFNLFVREKKDGSFRTRKT